MASFSLILRIAKLLSSLGLRKSPPVEEVLRIAADASNADRQKAALQYYLSELATTEPISSSKITLDLAWVPCVNADGSAGFGKPSECFSNAEAVVMGFKILRPEYRADLPKFRCVFLLVPHLDLRKRKGTRTDSQQTL